MMKKMVALGTQIVGRTSEGRPIILNPDGSYSTERTATVTHPLINGGKPTNIPTIFRGVELDPDQAAELIAKFSKEKKSLQPIDPETGRPLQAFNSIEDAEKEAQERSAAIELHIAKAFDPQKLQSPQQMFGIAPPLGKSAFEQGW